jgi:hypothetical protein
MNVILSEVEGQPLQEGLFSTNWYRKVSSNNSDIAISFHDLGSLGWPLDFLRADLNLLNLLILLTTPFLFIFRNS